MKEEANGFGVDAKHEYPGAAGILAIDARGFLAEHARLAAMQPGFYVDALEREGARVTAAARADLGAPIAACPGWVVADVLGHLGRVYRSVHQIVVERLTDPPTTAPPKPPAGAAVIAFYADALADLVAVLRETPAETRVYTWSSLGTVGFYQRRITHETGVHRLDVQSAVGLVDGFDPELAADGVSELYDVVLAHGLARLDRARVDAVADAGSMHLHRTDGHGEWTLEIIDGALHVGRGHGKATAALRGSASDLFVFAWNRGRGASLELFGDVAVADAWAGLAP